MATVRNKILNVKLNLLGDVATGKSSLLLCFANGGFHEYQCLFSRICFGEKIIADGVERFKKENCNLIIVDTSGRHMQEAALFEEMHQLSEVTKPDLIIFVMDSNIGQAAFDQAQAFRQSI